MMMKMMNGAKMRNKAMAKEKAEAPKMEIVYWDIEKLIPYARNPRKNDEAVPKMAGLIKEFGFKVPIVIRSDGSVIDGHLRLKAAQMLGMKEVPVVLADEWTEAQVKAFRLAVNRSAEWAEWDDELLKLELDDLKLENFDLGLIGFEDVLNNTPLEDYNDYETTEEPDEDEISDFVGHDEDYLMKKRVILVYGDDEESYLREHILHIDEVEKLNVVYDVEEIMKRDGQGQAEDAE